MKIFKRWKEYPFVWGTVALVVIYSSAIAFYIHNPLPASKTNSQNIVISDEVFQEYLAINNCRRMKLFPIGTTYSCSNGRWDEDEIIDLIKGQYLK